LKQYQSQRASIDDLLSWCCVFNEHNLAIVTGKISGLVVVNLDNSSLLEELKKQLPRVERTVKVKTKRGYYFHFSNNENEIRTTNNYLNLGIEIKYNGCYVVASTSIINDFQYTFEVLLSEIKPLPNYIIEKYSEKKEKEGYLTSKVIAYKYRGEVACISQIIDIEIYR